MGALSGVWGRVGAALRGQSAALDQSLGQLRISGLQWSRGIRDVLPNGSGVDLVRQQRKQGVLFRGLATASNSVLYAQLRGDEQAKGLLHTLRCEIEDLKKKAEGITQRSPPSPFKLVKDEPGELELTLSRIFGLEDISMVGVYTVVPKEYQRKPEQGEDPEMRKKLVQLTVSITKLSQHPVLKAKCECYRDGFAVHQVDLYSEDPDQTVYRPYFSERSTRLVDEMQIFLHERGLNEHVANYLHNALEYKRLLKCAQMLEKIECLLQQ